ERLVAVLAGIELRALLAVLVEPAGVVHGDVAAGDRFRAGAFDGVLVLQAGRGGSECHWGIPWTGVGIHGGAQSSGPVPPTSVPQCMPARWTARPHRGGAG